MNREIKSWNDDVNDIIKHMEGGSNRLWDRSEKGTMMLASTRNRGRLDPHSPKHCNLNNGDAALDARAERPSLSVSEGFGEGGEMAMRAIGYEDALELASMYFGMNSWTSCLSRAFETSWSWVFWSRPNSDGVVSIAEVSKDTGLVNGIGRIKAETLKLTFGEEIEVPWKYRGSGQ